MGKKVRSTPAFLEFAAEFRKAFELWAESQENDAARQRPRATLARKIGVTQKTIEHWLSGFSAPHQERWSVLKNLLGECPSVSNRLPQLEQRWSVVRASSKSQSVLTKAPVTAFSRDTGTWISTRRLPHPKLVDLAIDRPPQDGRFDDFYVTPTLIFGVAPLELDGHRASIGVRTATLLYRSRNCQPVAGSQYKAPPRCVPEGTGWRLTADPPALLRGDQVPHETLMRLVNTGDGPPSVELHVQCEDIDLDVTLRAKKEPTSLAHDRILVRFLQKCRRGQDGTISLAEANLRWRSGK